MRIALLPLDERPVHTVFPQAIGAMAGVKVDVPPRPFLPHRRKAANIGALSSWVLGQGASVDVLLISLDMLAYGGLIAGRTGDDTLAQILPRLDALRGLHGARPQLLIDAVSLVMRAADNYDAVEEPEYWAQHGRELHRFGAHLHRRLLAECGGEFTLDRTNRDLAELSAKLPRQIIAEFERRRLRNHTLNLFALDLLTAGALQTLLIAADENAEFSASSVEQIGLRHWGRALTADDESLLMYPGADEVGAVLVARALTRQIPGPVRFKVACAQPGGLQRTVPCESQPLTQSITRRINAAGGVVVNGSDADVVLVIHAPDPRHRDWGNGELSLTADDELAAVQTADLIDATLDAGAQVALADVRFGNGGDPELIGRLADRGRLLEIAAYGGWNHAGNTIGSVVATASARIVAERLGTLNENVARGLLLARLLVDVSYQAGLRPQLTEEYGLTTGTIIDNREDVRHLTERIAGHFDKELYRYAPHENWAIRNVTLPWSRTFEVGFKVTRGQGTRAFPSDIGNI